MQTTKTDTDRLLAEDRAMRQEYRARRIGAMMARLDAATDAETYMAVTKAIVADVEKDDRGIFTDRGMDELLHSFESAVAEFENDDDDSIERAERAAGA